MRSLATDLKIPFCPGLEFFGIDFFPVIPGISVFYQGHGCFSFSGVADLDVVGGAFAGED